jgi:hypothetical protein
VRGRGRRSGGCQPKWQRDQVRTVDREEEIRDKWQYCSPLSYLCREGVRREGEEMREELASAGEEERGRKKLGEKDREEGRKGCSALGRGRKMRRELKKELHCSTLFL